MASFLRIERVTALPQTLQGSTMYIVKDADPTKAGVYFTNTDGTEARHVIDKTDVQSMINTSIADFSNIQVVADIAARDTLGAGLTRNALVLAVDATGDTTVNTGAALYIYDLAAEAFTKVSEFESMDVVLEWSAIQGRPSSSVADIDDAVARKHSHTNLALLEKIGEDAQGKLMYNGQYPETYLATAQW